MALTLHASFVPSALRVLAAGQGWIDKAEAFAKENSLAESELVEAHLIGDMLPFSYQIKSMWVHSQGAIEGLRAGVFGPDMSEPPASFAALRAKLAEATAFLEALEIAELEELQSNAMRFEFKTKRLDFNDAGEFLLSFSQPNFYFHAVTAYDVLRNKGVPVGKLDYLGQLPVKA